MDVWSPYMRKHPMQVHLIGHPSPETGAPNEHSSRSVEAGTAPSALQLRRMPLVTLLLFHLGRPLNSHVALLHRLPAVAGEDAAPQLVKGKSGALAVCSTLRSGRALLVFCGDRLW